MKLIRSHLSIFYDDLWAEHVRLSTGRTVKPFKDRHKFGTYKLSDGFIKQKPDEFREIDFEIQYYLKPLSLDVFVVYNIIILADNRMAMGDYRYGRIDRQNLDNYDTQKEFFRRLKVAKETKNLEYIVDAYNMLRIEYYKKRNMQQIQDLFKHHFYIILDKALKEEWELISIDDGIHAQEK